MKPNRLIISRTDSIGDVILTLPMVGILKEMFPEIYILFLGSSYTKPIVECCKNVDEFVDWKEIENLDQLSQIEKFKSLKADTIIHVFPRKHIAKLSKKIGIKYRIGTSHRVYHWTTCNVKVNFSRKKSTLHEAQLNLKLLEPFDEFIKTYTLNEIIQYINFLPFKINFSFKDLIDKNRFNLILHPKSKGSAREWGVDNFEELINILPPEKYKIFICGTEQEKILIPNLTNLKRENLIDLTGKLSLQEYIEFINEADGLLAASTGPLHIAASLGKYAIGIFPPIHPMDSSRWAPIGKNVKVFQLEKKCSQCKKTMDCKCMKSIKPEDIKTYLSEINL